MDALRNSDNPRYSQDSDGQWWYTPGGPKIHGRTRAHIQTCPECGRDYLANIFHRKITKHCSRQCGGRVWNREHPGRFAGPRSGAWHGGRVVGSDGYIWVWNPEAARRMRPGTKKPYVVEHRLVMEQKLGRYLWSFENVHHKNGRRDDNRPENLEVWITNQPHGQRTDDLLAFVVEYYRDELTARLR